MKKRSFKPINFSRKVGRGKGRTQKSVFIKIVAKTNHATYQLYKNLEIELQESAILNRITKKTKKIHSLPACP